jgi:hypothetical protein
LGKKINYFSPSFLKPKWLPFFGEKNQLLFTIIFI